MDTNYKGLTMDEYQQLQEIKNWGTSNNRENRQNKSLDLGLEWL